MSKRIKDKILQYAASIGFSPVGITTPDFLQIESTYLASSTQAGFLADMTYAQRSPNLRLNPRSLMPEAKSVLVLGMPYCYPGMLDTHTSSAERISGYISVYARSEDYHSVIQAKLRLLLNYLREIAGNSQIKGISCVDATPLMERAFALHAGIGFSGKNTTLITRRHGSWVFLSELIVDIALPTDVSLSDNCGTCDECRRACPTGAIVEPYRLDSRLCISYQTIENRNQPIPDTIKQAMGLRVFGCDTCQNACSHNQHFQPGAVSNLQPTGRLRGGWLGIESILLIENEKMFRKMIGNSVISRVGWRGLQRNAAIVAGNARAYSLKPLLERMYSKSHDIPMLYDALSYALDLLRK